MKNSSTLYIDESGKSSLAEKQNEPFIITGVILNDLETQPVEGFLITLKENIKF